MSVRHLIERDEARRARPRTGLAADGKKLRRARAAAHVDIMRAVAEEAGVDYDAVVADFERRHRVEDRLIDRQIARVEQDMAERLRDDRERFERSLAYFDDELHDAFVRHFSNPHIIVETPEEWWDEVYLDGDETVEATGEFSEHDGVLRALHPRCHADVGHRQRESNFARVTQHLVYRVPPPDESYLVVDRVWLPFCGFGSYAGFIGVEPCVQFLGELVGRGVGLYVGVSITQELIGRIWELFPPVHPGEAGELLYEVRHGPGAIGFGEGALAESETIWVSRFLQQNPAAISGYPLMLFGPDTGGGDIIVHVRVSCRAGAFYRREYATISFAREFGGQIPAPGVILHYD